jgi:hypothetical protein
MLYVARDLMVVGDSFFNKKLKNDYFNKVERRNLDKWLDEGFEKWSVKLNKMSFDWLFCIKI